MMCRCHGGDLQIVLARWQTRCTRSRLRALGLLSGQILNLTTLKPDGFEPGGRQGMRQLQLAAAPPRFNDEREILGSREAIALDREGSPSPYDR